MAKLLPGRVHHGDYTAYAQPDGSYQVKNKHALVAVVPPSDPAHAEIPRFLESLQTGVQFVPSSPFMGKQMSPEEQREARVEVLERGSNCRLDVADWTRYLAATEAKEGGVFGSALTRYSSEQWPGFLRDAFASLYGMDERAADPGAGTEWMQQVLDAAEQMPEWQDLQRSANGDPWACGIGVSRVAEALDETIRELMNKLPAEDPQRLQEEAQGLESVLGAESEVVQQAQQAAQGAAQQADQVAQGLGQEKTQQAVAQALAQAAAEAAGEVQEMRAAMGGLAAGVGGGALAPVGADADKLRRLFSGNPALRRIAEIAGRMRMAAKQKQRTKTNYVPEQVADVTVGSELQRLLPAELVQLAMPETEAALLRRLMEGQALQYRLVGTERAKEGPVVLCVDESGSMAGGRHEWAMGVAVAVMEVCAKQRRPFALVHFDGRVQRVDVVPNPRTVTLEEIVDMVSFFSGGGTDFGAPLRRSLELIQESGTYEKADVILVTDGAGSWGNAATALRDAGVALYGVAIDAVFDQEQRTEMAGCAEISSAQIQGGGGAAEVSLVFGI